MIALCSGGRFVRTEAVDRERFGVVECRGMAAVMPLKFGCEQGMGVIYSDKQIGI